jgi:cellulose synthase/poly-beta-1,6-N-acetylglucosamine synthase-like glycosyltransferase
VTIWQLAGAIGQALLIAGWWLLMLLSTIGVFLYLHRVRRKFSAPEAHRVAILIPVKGQLGERKALEDLIESCLTQLGGSGRVVLAVENADDPAAATITAAAAADPRVTLVVAGIADWRAQKVDNLLAALTTLRPEDRIIVFADIRPAPNWLAQLLRPIVNGRAQITSGYRWILPADNRLPSRLAALMDWGVATAGRSRRWNLCWGGSTALTREALDQIDLRRQWSRALSDDLTLTQAARRAGIAIHAAHQVLAPSPARHDWRGLMSFGRRQYLVARFCAPRHWWIAGLALALPVAGCADALFLSWRHLWLGPFSIAMSLVLQQVRASVRVAIAGRVLPKYEAVISATLIRRNRWLLPAAHLVHLAIWLSSAIGRTLIWSGVRYRIDAEGAVIGLNRPNA